MVRFRVKQGVGLCSSAGGSRLNARTGYSRFTATLPKKSPFSSVR